MDEHKAKAEHHLNDYFRDISESFSIPMFFGTSTIVSPCLLGILALLLCSLKFKALFTNIFSALTRVKNFLAGRFLLKLSCVTD